MLRQTQTLSLKTGQLLRDPAVPSPGQVTGTCHHRRPLTSVVVQGVPEELGRHHRPLHEDGFPFADVLGGEQAFPLPREMRGSGDEAETYLGAQGTPTSTRPA